MKIYNKSRIDDTQAASAFAALGSEQRLGILKTLVRAGPAGLAMGMLGERTQVTGSTLTHHLKILAAAGLVDQEKKGRSVVCTAVAFSMVDALSSYLLEQCCADTETPNRNELHSHD